jgi:ATP-dependent Clp protease adaptor protein ClpS
MSSNPQRDRPDVDVDIDISTLDVAWFEPPYCVIIHNDHVTTFDFVERLLMSLFKKTADEAELIAWITHTQGNCVVVIRPQSEAEALARKGVFAARLEGYPLRLTAEPE